jgi:7-cyano-7-deazaguanine synthase
VHPIDPPVDAGDRALVLFSGGQDSTICLAWALERFRRVETVGFDYGQRHSVELACQLRVLDELRAAFPAWSDRLGRHHVIDVCLLAGLSDSVLTGNGDISVGDAAGLPTTFVPGRNIVFLSFAAVIAYRQRIGHIVGGMCETDYSGYPDCRDDAIKALQVALNLGMASRFVIETPLMWLDKAAAWRLAERLGGAALVALIGEHTHTCYLGQRTHRHEWGYGCGECAACRLRADGYARFRAGAG